MPKTRKNRRGKTSRGKKGGLVLAQGTYGCVFSPPLPCVSSGRPDGSNVSKLMLEGEARHEYEELTRFASIVQRIPNFTKYFIMSPIDMCRVDASALTAGDFSGSRCDIASLEEVRTRPSDYAIIQMPNGGIEARDYFRKGAYLTDEGFKAAISNMVGLLEHGIVPMNKLGLYHLDMKSQNIVIDKRAQPRIIDWGFGFYNRGRVRNAAMRGREAGIEDGMYAINMYNAPIIANMVYEQAFMPQYEEGNEEPGDFTGEIRADWVEYMKTGELDDADAVIDSFLDGGHGSYFWSNILSPACKVFGADPMHIMRMYVSLNRDAYYDKLSPDLFKHDLFYRNYFENADQWGWATSFVDFIDIQQHLDPAQAEAARQGAAGCIMYIMTRGAVSIDTKTLGGVVMTMVDPKIVATRTRQRNPKTTVARRTLDRVGSARRTKKQRK